MSDFYNFSPKTSTLQDTALLIFIKNPILGTAKTRLAKTIGDEQAMAVYLELLEHTRNISRKLTGKKFLFYNQFIDREDEWSNQDFDKQLQAEGDLGIKMRNAFEMVFQEGYQKAIVIGSDCGELQTDVIERAFVALDKHELVIGPARDGGYYLLGMRNFHIYPFKNKQWSTETLFRATVSEIIQKKHSLYQLVTLNDVDEYEDLVEWKAL